jgi:hypothetical protein
VPFSLPSVICAVCFYLYLLSLSVVFSLIKKPVVWRWPSSGRYRPDDGGSKDLRNVGKLLPDYTALQPRRQPSSYSPPWEPQIEPVVDQSVTGNGLKDRSSALGRVISLRHLVQAGSGAHPASSPMAVRRWNARSVKRTIHPHLEPRLRTRGALPSVPHSHLQRSA